MAATGTLEIAIAPEERVSKQRIKEYNIRKGKRNNCSLYYRASSGFARFAPAGLDRKNPEFGASSRAKVRTVLASVLVEHSRGRDRQAPMRG
jgi:hypothetical protein